MNESHRIQLPKLARLFDSALRKASDVREGALALDWARLEAERRRIQRANGYNERGEPLS